MLKFKNGLMLGCYMSGSGDGTMAATGGSVTNLGGTMRVVAGEDPKDVSNTGAQAADAGIDPATGKPKVVTETPVEDKIVKAAEGERNPDGTFKTKETTEKPAEKEAPKAPTAEELEAAKTEAAKTDPRFVPFTEEFMTTGDLKDTSRDQAAKDFGVSRAIVDAWVEGQKATKTLTSATTAVDQVQADRTVAAIKGMVGTEAEYNQFSTWANANLPAEDMATLVEAINSGKPGLYKLAMNDAVAKYKAAGNTAGPRDLTNGGTNEVPRGPTGYANAAEQSKAINDPRYRTDDAYRAEVAAKIAVTRF